MIPLGEYQCLKDSLLSAAQRGKDLLAKVRVQPPEVIPYNALDIEDARQRQQRQRRLNANESIVRQMMAEIAQHERDLDSFWLLHKERSVTVVFDRKHESSSNCDNSCVAQF